MRLFSLVVLAVALLAIVGSANAGWWNNSYAFCRNVTNIAEINGVNLTNEPFNHGKGWYVDSSGWANKPHLNGWALVNAPCNADGNAIPADLANPKNGSNGLMNNFTIVSFGNATANSNNTYSFYYALSNIGTPYFTPGITSSESGGAYAFNAGGAFNYTVDSAGGNPKFDYYGFSYVNTALGYGYPSFVNLDNGAGGLTAFGSGATDVTCSYVLNGSFTKWLNCTNSANNTISQEYRVYALLGQTPKVDTTTNLQGVGTAMMRAYLASTISSLRAQRPTNYANFTHTDYYQSLNGTVFIRFTGSPNSSKAALLIMRQQGGKNANATWYGNFGASNIQLGMAEASAGSTSPPYRIPGGKTTFDARYAIYLPASYSDADGDNMAGNATKYFNDTLGSSVAFSSEMTGGISIGTPSINTTLNGTLALVQASFTASTGALSNYSLEFDNGNGTLYNASTFLFSGTTNTSNATLYLNATPNSTVRIGFYGCGTTGCVGSVLLNITTKESNVPSTDGATQNNTFAGGATLLSANWYDDFALMNATLEFDNGNGTLYNTSTIGISGVSAVSSFIVVVNSTLGSNVRWRIYGCDFFNNCNRTALQSFTTSGVGTVSSNKANYTEYEQANLTLPYYALPAGTLLSVNFTVILQNGTAFSTNVTSLVSSSGSLAGLVGVFDANLSMQEWRNFSAVGFLNGTPFATSNATASVFRILITNCSGAFTNATTLTLVLLDEETDAALYNGSIEISTDASTAYYSRNYPFAFNLTGKYNQSLCLFPTWTTYLFSSTIAYRKTNYAERSYLIYANFSNVAQTLNLYLLDSSLASQVLIYVVDENNNPVSDVTVKVQRYYVGSNSYKTVAQVLSDFEGKGSANLRVNDVYYRFVLAQNGTVLAEFSPTIIVCKSGTCPPYSITLPITSLEGSPYFVRMGAFSYTCGYNAGTSVLSCTVDDTSGISKSAALYVDLLGALNATNVCTATCASSACTLTCNLGNVTGTLHQYRFYVYDSGGNPTLVTRDFIDYTTGLFNWGTSGLLGGFFLVGTLFFVGIFNPVAALVMALVGIISGSLLGLLPVTIGSLIGLTFAIILIAWKMRS